jgi:sulfate adenylyltransferase
MRFAGPREAVWHAIIRRNYGANYFIVGRDHASPGLKADGKPFYSPYGAQVLLEKVKEDIGVTPVPFEEIVYVPDIKRYIVKSKIMKGQNYHSLSGTSVRTKYRKNDDPLPEWYTRPEVARILAHALVPSERRGFCVWFTGLPCAGKSTIATVLNSIIQKEGRRTTFLDGDIVRTHLSKGLGFTKVDRDANVLRIGFVAAEIVKHHGVAICAAVSPYENTRSQVRNLMPEGSFILIYVNTPLSVCKKRDQKGLYKKALAGEITEFTGVDDVYEPPMRSEVKLTTVRYSPVVNAQRILGYLRKRGFLIHESKT